MEVFPMATENKRLLKKLGNGFFKIAELSRDIIWIRSADFQQQLYVNKAYQQIFKYPPKQLYTNSIQWINSVAVEDRDRLRQRFIDWQLSVSSVMLDAIEYRIFDDEGEIHWLRDSCYPIYEGKTCLAFVGLATDITSEKLRIKETNQASYFFRYFLEKIKGVFWVKDHRGKKQIYISPGYEKIWGQPVDSLYANPASWLDSVLQEDRENGKIDLRFYDTSEQVPNKKYELRFRIQRPDGEIRWIKDTHFPVIEKEKLIGFAGIAEDITADVRRENELREAKEIAEQANRTKSDFLAMMSHELRTPLNAILGMTQILKSSDLSEYQSDQIEVIAQSGQNLLSLLNDLLDFAKLEVGKLSFSEEPINLKQLITQVVDDMRASARQKNLSLKCCYTENVPITIIGDAKRIRQIMVNLLSNAIKFTEKGHVQLAISCLQKNYKEATLCFTVEDTGIGIEKMKLATIFNRFQQIDSVYQRKHDGVGLGLSIVKELVEKMHGNIAVSSEVGVGSQFSCIIPFYLQNKEEEVTLPSHYNNQQPINNVGQTRFDMDVLVVEDNLINQKVSKILLEQVGCHVDIASSAKEAFEKMKKRYDMVFMDIGLPDMDGFEAVARIRRSERPGYHVPIVAMTAHVFAQDRERCFNVGMDEVMAKPILREDLVKVLKRWAA